MSSSTSVTFTLENLECGAVQAPASPPHVHDDVGPEGPAHGDEEGFTPPCRGAGQARPAVQLATGDDPPAGFEQDFEHGQLLRAQVVERVHRPR